jgi:hypothetical protein
MQILGICQGQLVIEPAYAGDSIAYLQLDDSALSTLKEKYSLKEYSCVEEVDAYYFYGKSLEEFNQWYPEFISQLKEEEEASIDFNELPF